MTAYTDVTQANALVEEQTRLSNGVAMLDNGGTVTSFTVSPIAGTMPGPSMMPVSILTVVPPADLIASARAAMVARHNAISDELTAIGVTGAPPLSV